MRDSTETIRVRLGAGDNGWSGHGLDERTAFGFVSEDGDERRGIDDHSARQPVLVVPEDLVRRPGIEDGELGAAARDVVQVIGQAPLRTLSPDTRKPIPQSLDDRLGLALAGPSREFACEAFCFFVSYIL